jgi:hypothetical protein
VVSSDRWIFHYNLAHLFVHSPTLHQRYVDQGRQALHMSGTKDAVADFLWAVAYGFQGPLTIQRYKVYVLSSSRA